MARRKKGLVPEDDEPKVDISSLIDVCFLLLIYFIVTSTIAQPESDLMLALPSDKSDSSDPPDVDPAFFVVLENGSIQRVEADRTISSMAGAGGEGDELKHRKPDELVQLDKAVAAYQAMAGDDAMVKVKAEPQTKAQYVIDLLNILAKHNITKITFTQKAD